jgi:putative DNA primase/helicase
MPLRNLVKVLGGDLYDGGRRANVPYPGHSRVDRSLSLLCDNGRVIVSCFGDGDWKAALDHLRSEGLIDAHHRPTGLGSLCSTSNLRTRPSRIGRTACAIGIWNGGRPVAGTLAETHLHLRLIRRAPPGPEAARFNAATPLSAYRDGEVSANRPALILAIREALGAITGVEVTYLRPGGRRADDLKLPRKHVGCVPAGSAVRLDPAASEMLVAEGAFTALSASERFSLPAWALLPPPHPRGWVAPEGVRSVLIAGDNGEDGRRSARVLAARLRNQGVRTRLAFPAAPFGDWNDAAHA